MAEPREGQRIEGGSGLDRILALSDGVFAIAITLLVLNIEVPEIPEDLVAQELAGELLDLWPNYLSYVFSFLVVFTHWLAHHSIFGAIRNYDRGLMWLNSLFLMCVAFLPFPAALFSEYEDQQLVVAIYAGSMAITRLLLTAVWWYASGDRRLVVEGLDPGTTKAFSIRGLTIPLIFLLSIVISFFSVTAAIFSWLLLVVIDFVLLRMLRRYEEIRH
jgi:uncharacterized membrane protein